MKTPESEEEELQRLTRRIEELEREGEALRRTAQQYEDRFRLLTAVTRECVFIIDQGRIADVGTEFEPMYGYKREEIIGQRPPVLVAPEFVEYTMHYIDGGYEEPYEAVHVRKDGTRFAVRIWGKGLVYEGRSMRVTAVVDLTERKRTEETRKAAIIHEKVIRAQATILAQLSTPLLPIADGVVVLPLIGAVNATRAARVIETLTQGVFAHRAAIAVLDITGVREVDAQVADMLVQAAQAVQLLGARVLLTGVRPEVAQALVELGKDLTGVVTYGTLQQGVTDALRQGAG